MNIEQNGGAPADDDYIDDSIMAEMAATPPLSTKPEPDDGAGAAPTEPVIENKQDVEPPKPGEPDPADPATDDKGKFVPHAKFNELYHRNKTLETRTNQLLGILEQMQRNGQPQQQAPQEPEIPKLPTEPLERLEFLSKWYEDSQNAHVQSEQQRQQQAQEQAYIGQVAQWAEQDHVQRLAEDPTYEGAYEHLIASRTRELSRNMPAQQANLRARQEALQVSIKAHQDGVRPTDVFMEYAQARGWQPKAPVQQQTQRDPVAQENRRQQHMSLSQLGGQAGKVGITAKDLANMDEDDFAKLSDQTVQALMRA